MSNVFIRFIWAWFFVAPTNGLNITARTFIFGALEILRRVQWNFCACLIRFNEKNLNLTYLSVRLENEHLGNMDQYRVTREVPLPYNLPEDAEDDIGPTKSAERWSIRRRRKPQPPAVRLPEMSTPVPNATSP